MRDTLESTAKNNWVEDFRVEIEQDTALAELPLFNPCTSEFLTESVALPKQVHMDSVNLGSPTSTSHLVGPASGPASASNTSTGLNKYSRLPNESDSPGHAAAAGGDGGTFGRAMQQQQQLVRDQVRCSEVPMPQCLKKPPSSFSSSSSSSSLRTSSSA